MCRRWQIRYAYTAQLPLLAVLTTFTTTFMDLWWSSIWF